MVLGRREGMVAHDRSGVLVSSGDQWWTVSTPAVLMKCVRLPARQPRHISPDECVISNKQILRGYRAVILSSFDCRADVR
jgi:hypothetical protein